MSNSKVFVLGIDGAEPSLFYKWIKEGKLPNLEKIFNKGTSGKLESVFPQKSAVAWVPFMTGKSPARH